MLWLTSAQAVAGGCSLQVEGATTDPERAAALAMCLERYELDALAMLAHQVAARGPATREHALDALTAHAETHADPGPLRWAVADGGLDPSVFPWLVVSAPYDAGIDVDASLVPRDSLAALYAWSREAWAANAAGKFRSEVMLDREAMVCRTAAADPRARLLASEAKDRALVDVSQVYADLGRFDNAVLYAAMVAPISGAVHLALDVVAVAEAQGGKPPPPPGGSAAAGWQRRTLERDAPFAPATHVALAAVALRSGDTGTLAADHLERFAAQLADVDAAVARAEAGVGGWELWRSLSPSLQADLEQRLPIAGPVERRWALGSDSLRARRRGVEDWATAAMQDEFARIDAELDAELLPALRRRAALAHDLADEAEALGRGEPAASPATSLGAIADYGFWPGSPRHAVSAEADPEVP